MHTDRGATERRITELYTKAADLGAQFAGYAWFEEKQFFKGAGFNGARVAFGAAHVVLPDGWTTRAARTAEGEKECWLYVVRVEDGCEQQPDREDRRDREAGTSGT